MTRIKDIKNNKTYYITYDANKCGQPIKMWLKGKQQNLLWEDKNLIQIGEHIKYSYNTEGIRTKKETEEGTAAYIDYQDDGQIFNGSVAWYDYLGATVLGGAIGAGLGAFAGMSFSASISTFGWINSGGTLMFGITGTIEITVSGKQVLSVAGALVANGLLMFAKGNGPRMGHNQYENKQFNSLCNKYKLSKEQRRILHDYISGQNYSYKEIEQLIIELFFS